MELIGWALFGIVFGAAGTEFLRSKKPEFVQKVEEAAKRFVASWEKSDSEEKGPEQH